MGRKQRPGSPANQAKERKERKAAARKKRRKPLLITGAVLLILLVGAGAAITTFDRRADALRDLSPVGRGTPAVVQVHDNTCPICTELRNQVSQIENEFPDKDLLIRVADVHTDSGLEFAARYTTARRATLLFLDGEGELVHTVSGAHEAGTLRQLFRRHVAGEL